MPKALENQVVLTDQPKSYEELFERLVKFWSSKAALRTAAGAIKDNRPKIPWTRTLCGRKARPVGKATTEKEKTIDRRTVGAQVKAEARREEVSMLTRSLSRAVGFTTSLGRLGGLRPAGREVAKEKASTAKKKTRQGRRQRRHRLHPQIKRVQAPSWSTQHLQ